MQIAANAPQNALVSIVPASGNRAEAAKSFASTSKTVAATGSLTNAVAYASGLVMRGWAGTVGVLQAEQGWKLVALEQDGAPSAITGAAQVRRHTYDLAAVVNATHLAVWEGKQRVSPLFAVGSPVVIPSR